MANFSSPRGRSGQGGVFGQHPLLILVGSDKEPFHVHPTQLAASTSFFRVHGEPPTKAQKEELARTTGATRVDKAPQTEIKREPDERRSPTAGPEEIPDNANVILPDYHLDSQLHVPESFEIIVKWLYNQHPSVPRVRQECKTLLRAYILAVQYDILPLQDVIIENFRIYHREFNSSFGDLLWLVNRVGDNLDTHAIPMVRYFAEQIAYEVVDQGYNAFINNNPFFEVFLKNGDRPIRAVIFEALTNVARMREPVDPAVGPNRWTVESYAPARPRPAGIAEMIEID